MRFVLQLWDAIQQHDLARLRRCILVEEQPDGSWRARYRTREESGDGYRMGVIYDTARERYAGLASLITPGEVSRPALFVVQKLVNEQLWIHAGPSLLYEPSKDHLNLRIVPKNLLGALWLEFARGIDGNKDYRKCRECGRWFEISLEAGRPTKFFCSNACRSKAYRERQAAAQRLSAEGISLEDIAHRLGTDVATAQGWITRPPRHPRRSGSY
jgi:hypothetical protein